MDFVDEVIEERDLIRNSSMVFFSGLASGMTLFLANLYLSNLFGSVAFGTFKTVLYISMLFPGLIDFGITITLPKYIADPRYKNKIGCLARRLIVVKAASFLLMLVAVFLFKDTIASNFLHDQTLAYLIIAGLSCSFSAFFGVLSEMVRGYENFRLYSLSMFLKSFLYLVFGCVLGYYFGVFYALIGFGIAGIIGNLVCIRFLIRKGAFKIKENADVRKVFLRYSLPMHVVTMPSYLVNAIIPFLSLFFTPEAIGYYSFAFMFYYTTGLIPSSIQSAFFPKISRLNSNGNGDASEKSLKRVLKIYTPIVLLGLAGIMLFSRMFIGLIARDYLPGLVMFRIMISLGLIFGYFGIYSSYLTAKGEIKTNAVVVLVQNLLLFLISFTALRWFF